MDIQETGAGTTPQLAEGTKIIEVPVDFQDPITHELMLDPVMIVETGHTYNRASIQQWFQRGNATCPKTNRKLKSLLVATNWTLRSLIYNWAERNSISLPEPPSAQKLLEMPPAASPAAGAAAADASPSSSTQGAMVVAASGPLAPSGLQSHPITLGDGDSSIVAGSSARGVSENWTFFQGLDSPGGDLFRLHFDHTGSASGLMQLLEAADKVPNCIAFNSSGHLKSALQPRASWILCDELQFAGEVGQRGLYVRTQCLPFIESGCNSWAADAAAMPPTDNNGWTFFPGMDSPGGDICQAITANEADGALAGLPGGSITSSSALALLALAKPICVAFNSNGWLKALLQPMHGWVKWTTEAGKGLFVRNDVLRALLSGVLAHVQGNQLAPVQLAGWTFFQGLDSLGGDAHWSWQNANEPVKLAAESLQIEGAIAFNTNGHIKTALRPRAFWTKVEVWADKPCAGIYVHNSVLWKLLLS